MKVYLSMPRDAELTKTFFPPELIEKLEDFFDMVYLPGNKSATTEDFLKYAKGCDAVITGWGHPVISSDMISATKIKLIAHTGGTVGSLVAPDVYDSGVKVISGNRLFAESVAEGVIAYMLMGRRRLPHYVNNVREGGWDLQTTHPTKGLLGETVGLVGFGTITRALIEMLQAFNVKIMLYSSHLPSEEYCKKYNVTTASINDIFSKCKIVSIHSAMNERTRGMIGKEQFDLLCDGALFINTARGKIIKEEEMIDALKENRFDAVLDVYCSEPLEIDSPLRTLDNVYPMPHVAGPTFDKRPRIADAIIDNILKFERGEEMELEISKCAAARMTVVG